MGILLNRLLTILNDRDPDSTEYHIAFTLLQNFYALCSMSIGEVARMCSVSKSTISKFIRSIDFEDYADFRAAAPFEENKYGFELNYNSNIAEFIECNGCGAYFDAIEADIQNCRKNLTMDGISELAKDLVQYKKVASFGLLFSEIAAIDLQTKLAYNGKFIITNLNDVKQDAFIRNADQDTLLIIFSNSGSYINKYQMSEFQTAKDYSSTKAKIVLITANEAMKTNSQVDLCICFRHTSSIQTHSILYPLINDMIVMKYRELTRN